MGKTAVFLGLLLLAGWRAGPVQAGAAGKIPYFENETFESNFRKGVEASVTLRDGRVVELHSDYTWDWATPADTGTGGAGTGGGAPGAPETRKHARMPPTARQAVKVWDTTFDWAEVDSRPAVRLFVHYQNNTPRKVVGVSITVKIANAFGKTLYEFSKDDDVVVAPMDRMRNDAYFVWQDDPDREGDPYDRMWEAARNGTAKVTVKVRKVLFADGTVLTGGGEGAGQ